jgi:HPt (histidine-containing phosphotransfer) domain-containing protein
MTIGKHERAKVTAYADHEVIVPPNRLRKACVEASSEEVDPVARAEQALAALSNEFSAWMEAECARLDAARRDVTAQGFLKEAREALFRAAHDIKGHAATFGYPLAAPAAESLCRLIEGAPVHGAVPLMLIEQHVDAVKAIVREHASPYAERMASELNARLREVTEEFLLRIAAHGSGETDIASPPTAPAFSVKRR